MTGLVFLLTPEAIWIAMDSLAVYADDKTAFKYGSKILIVPHLAAAICATGSLGFGAAWYMEIFMQIVARDIDFVNEIAPERLRSLAARLNETGTSTIYHFGFSPLKQAFTGFAFRSTHEFIAEELDYGIGIKPPYEEAVSMINNDLESDDLVAGIIRIFERVREADDARKIADRVGIGGEIHFLTMKGPRQYLHVIDCWPDYAEKFDEMLANLKKRNIGKIGK